MQSLRARDFRGFAQLDIVVPPEGMAVVAPNASGKTNFLEALYYLQLLRSFRGSRDTDVVRFDAPGFHASAEVDGSPLAKEIAVGFERASHRKRATIDGAAPARLSDAFGALPAVMCSPSDVEIVAGPPAERRRFLDVLLASRSRRYLRALQQYRTALSQRNSALRAAARAGAADTTEVAVWEPPLAEHGAILVDERREWTHRHGEEFADYARAIGESGTVTMRYSTRVAGDASCEAIATALAEQREHDLRRGATHAGPHRDDLVLELGGREMREFASGGQQRTAALALRMTEASTLLAAHDVAPVLLLDDPFAELDTDRAAGILRILRGVACGQTFLCVPRADHVPAELSQLERWTIRDGKLMPM